MVTVKVIGNAGPTIKTQFYMDPATVQVLNYYSYTLDLEKLFDLSAVAIIAVQA